MQVDRGGDPFGPLTAVATSAAAAEADGYDAYIVPETRNDVFIGLTIAAGATSTIAVQSGIAVAFARTPMTVAVAANGVQAVSGGRLQLGLGTQVRAHVERRFGMPWSHPAARMEEFVGALHAIWEAWQTGSRLRFEGTFYRHTLMTEFFDPGPNPYGTPPVLLAAVGQRMAAVAGRVADGLLCHTFSTAEYLAQVTLPVVHQARGGDMTGFSVSLPVFVVLGASETERAAADHAVRRQLAFYGSTPSYRPVLEHHGWGELADRLTALSRNQDWEAMAAAIDDDVLDAFAVAGSPARVADEIRRRYGHLVNRIALYTPYPADPGLVRDTTAGLRKP